MTIDAVPSAIHFVRMSMAKFVDLLIIKVKHKTSPSDRGFLSFIIGRLTTLWDRL